MILEDLKNIENKLSKLLVETSEKDEDELEKRDSKRTIDLSKELFGDDNNNPDDDEREIARMINDVIDSRASIRDLQKLVVSLSKGKRINAD